MTKNNLKILLVEDEPDICGAVQSYLGKRGCAVSTTASGKEALSMIDASRPDIVFLDLALNDINGKDVLKTLRQSDKTTKVIIVTGQLLPEEELKSIHSLGISAYLNKPILLEQIGNIINEVLNQEFSRAALPKSRQKLKTAVFAQDNAAHELANLLGIIRSKCENFVLDIEEGIAKDKSDKELVATAVDIMTNVMSAVDRAAKVVENMRGSSKKSK